MSTFPPQTPPCQQNFPVRNRLLAALCDALVVARAGSESGALMTGYATHRLGRPVFGVCGRIGEEQSRGVTRLLREAVARPADDASDVFAALDLVGARRGAPGTKAVPLPLPVQPKRPVPAQYQKVVSALRDGPRAIDEIAAAVDLPVSALASALTELELLGLCEARLGGMFAVAPDAGFDCATEAV